MKDADQTEQKKEKCPVFRAKCSNNAKIPKTKNEPYERYLSAAMAVTVRRLAFFPQCYSFALRWHTKNSFVFIYISVRSFLSFTAFIFAIFFTLVDLSLSLLPLLPFTMHKKHFNESFFEKKEMSVKIGEIKMKSNWNSTDRNITIRGSTNVIVLFLHAQKLLWYFVLANSRKIIFILCNLCATVDWMRANRVLDRPPTLSNLIHIRYKNIRLAACRDPAALLHTICLPWTTFILKLF